jgi:hypothetical protein
MNESVDEDLCQRLVGQKLPSVQLSSTAGGVVDLAGWPAAQTVIYCYPLTREPGKPAPTDWDLIPGARGCTPQACTFRDHYQELQALRRFVDKNGVVGHQHAERLPDGFGCQLSDWRRGLGARLTRRRRADRP